ncbi:MAG: lysine-2,3-aminomutase-like protein [Hyphomicrobiales bacterium]|nr:lysine-2,3-aminomutase-like protein [Hyphomicrobiales bacterium]
MSAPDRNRSATLVQPADFVAAGLAPAGAGDALAAVTARYSAAMTRHLADLVDPDDPADPIASQFVPSVRELVADPRDLVDPIGDDPHSPCEGVVHRYPDRALLKLVAACPVYCRFCFRRETVGAGKGGMLPPAAFAAALDYVRTRTEIREVILTGGDPLALSPRRLAGAMRAIAEIGHVGTIRIHSRVPVAAPDLVTPELIAALKVEGAATWVAVHANHPRELTALAREKCAALVEAGVPLVSQTVLLRGVNDDPQVLADLMRGFVEARIKPYYLHHPDLAPGTAHFRLPIADGRRIVAAALRRVSGLARPAYVLDIPGGYGKIGLSDAAAREMSPGEWRLTDPAGRVHAYREAAKTGEPPDPC